MEAVSCGTVGRQVGVGGGASVFPSFFFVRPALQPPPLAGSLLCVTRRPTVRRPLVGLSQAALRYPPSPEGLALNPTSAALTARGAREPMGV